MLTEQDSKRVADAIIADSAAIRESVTQSLAVLDKGLKDPIHFGMQSVFYRVTAALDRWGAAGDRTSRPQR
jgi:hypothetical protein